MKPKPLRKDYQYLTNPLYLNANLLYGEGLFQIRKKHWKRKIKIGTLRKLLKKYHLVTSILTRMEFIQRLSIEENIPLATVRKIYHAIIEEYRILEITGIDKYVNLTDCFIDSLATSNLGFKDAIHLQIAKQCRIPLCTHDKKMKKNFSNHEHKSKFYSEVYKPQELIR